MLLLITGGALGLAVLAILGAVLLGISEDRSERLKKDQQAQQALLAQQNSVPALFPQSSQSLPAISQGPVYPSVPATPLLPRQTIALPASGEDETTSRLSLAGLDGQVREITGELRMLAQRAGELQQRLTTLSEALESQEQSYPEPSHSGLPADLFMSDTETQVR